MHVWVPGCSSHLKYCNRNSSFFNACPLVLFFEWTTTLLMPSSHSKTQPKLLIAMAITYLSANLLPLHHLFQHEARIKGLSDTRGLGNVGIDSTLGLCCCEEMRRSDEKEVSVWVCLKRWVLRLSVKGRVAEIFISRWHHCWRTPVVLLLKMVRKLQSHCFLPIDVWCAGVRSFWPLSKEKALRKPTLICLHCTSDALNVNRPFLMWTGHLSSRAIAHLRVCMFYMVHC